MKPLLGTCWGGSGLHAKTVVCIYWEPVCADCGAVKKAVIHSEEQMGKYAHEYIPAEPK